MEKFGIKIKGIVKYKDKFLVVKKWYDDRITDPFQWEFIDAELEYGINPESCVLQIISKETELVGEIKDISYIWSYELGDNQYIGIAFLCEVNNDLVILSEDLSEYAWVTAKELPEYITNPDIIEDLKRTGII